MRSSTPQQHRAASASYPPNDTSYPTTIPSTSPSGNGSLRRKGSFSFLRRSKSRDRSASDGSTPRRKLSKKERSKVWQQEMMSEQVPSRPPRIPNVPRQPDLQTFGIGDTMTTVTYRPGGPSQPRLAQKSSQETIGADMYRGTAIPPVPPIPAIPGAMLTKSPYIDSVARSESMTHRGRYSYASSLISTINSPRKIRRRKDPTPFNILAVGARGVGKTSFLNFLRTSLAIPLWKQRQQSHDDTYMTRPYTAAEVFPTFTSQFVETEIESERIGVTLWDSEGLEANVVDIQIQKIASFIESKFEDTFNEENQVARAPGFRDSHIHCVFLILDPVRLDTSLAASHVAREISGVKAKANSFAKGRTEPISDGLDLNLDLNVLRGLKGKTTVVPIISKADTVTVAHMAHLKRVVWQSLKKNGLENLEGLTQEGEDDADSASDYDTTNGLDERDENEAKAEKDGDKFSSTSVLDSPSDSNSEFSASDFDLAKPGKPSIISSAPTPSSLAVSPSALNEPPALPFSIISPDPYEPEIMGRKFPWGVADPMNTEHCNFVRLKESVFTDWRGSLREASRELWYEGWRTSRLNKRARRDGGFVGDLSTQAWAL